MIEPKRTVLFVERRRNVPVDPDAWKKLIGEKPVEARLETLPETKIRRGVFAISSTVQVALAVALASLPLLFPETLSMRKIYEVTPIAAPTTEVPVPADTPAEKIEAQPPAPADPVEPAPVPKVMVPRALIAPKPRVLDRQEQVAVPKLDSVLASAKFDTGLPEPVKPREPVRTGVMNNSSDAQPTLTAALEKVQTGGFGDPQGIGSDANASKGGNVASVGSFELPSGPGYGNGTGGAHGVVASSGFGSAVATPAAANGNRTAVRSGGFGSVTAAPEAKATPKQATDAPGIQPVVILQKPNPIYTDEARKLGIEGEVLVEVIFRASGQVQTVRVVKGLGHGLDEAALRAAEQIRFKPAMQQGQAVDFPAVAHIVFQLAF